MAHGSRTWWTALALGALTALTVTSCDAPKLGGGEFGKYRFVNRAFAVKGQLPLFPPMADIAGNVYSVYGALLENQVGTDIIAYVSRTGGGETVICNHETTPIKQDRYGAHGFSGYSQEKVWFWAGDNLVEMGPFQSILGSPCRKVLEFDPGTNTLLHFKAIMPWVYDAPSRTTLTAIVNSDADPAPFVVQVDLRSSIFAKVDPFDPIDVEPKSVQIVGVGGDRVANQGSVLLQFAQGGADHVQGRIYDRFANIISVAEITTPKLQEYGIQGYLQHSSKGLIVGLLNDNQLVVFTGSEGRVQKVENGITPVGVHAWEGNLYLVGTADNKPVIAPIDDQGNPGAVVEWTASEHAAAVIAGGNLTILDDRTLPIRTVVWDKTANAMGPFPFVTPMPPNKHATDTTLWYVTGPSVQVDNLQQLAFAMAPVGITYP